MKLDAKDFKRLKWAIAFLVTFTLVGGGSVWTILQMKKSSDRAFQEASTARKDIQNKLSQARVEEQELRDKTGRFQALKAQGYIGPEKRLDWIETIARIKASRRISRLDYDFAPQRPVDAALLPGGASAGNFEIMSSQMQLRLHLLHEGELLALLDDIRSAVPAMIQVRSCAIERLAPSVTDRGHNAQLKADCILEWITLREGK